MTGCVRPMLAWFLQHYIAGRKHHVATLWGPYPKLPTTKNSREQTELKLIKLGSILAVRHVNKYGMGPGYGMNPGWFWKFMAVSKLDKNRNGETLGCNYVLAYMEQGKYPGHHWTSRNLVSPSARGHPCSFIRAIYAICRHVTSIFHIVIWSHNVTLHLPYTWQIPLVTSWFGCGCWNPTTSWAAPHCPCRQRYLVQCKEGPELHTNRARKAWDNVMGTYCMRCWKSI